MTEIITVTETKHGDFRVFDCIALESFIFESKKEADVVAESFRNLYKFGVK